MSEAAVIGYSALCIAFVMTAVTGIAAVITAKTGAARYRTVAEYGSYLVCTLFAVAATAMIHAFINHDYSLIYVYKYSDAKMPWIYQLTAFWGGQEGSLQFWATILSIFLSLVVLVHRGRDQELMPWVIAVLCGILLYFDGLLLFAANPFETYTLIDPSYNIT